MAFASGLLKQSITVAVTSHSSAVSAKPCSSQLLTSKPFNMGSNAVQHKALIFAIFAIICGICQCEQPSYQVWLYAKLHPKGPPIHICNGVIIHNRLVLTTASCIYYQLTTNSPVLDIPAAMLTVVTGSSDISFNELLSFDVSEIMINTEFNSSTLANDMAILRLSEPLPLSTRLDIKWIILEDFEGQNRHCSAIYGSAIRHYSYTQKSDIPILKAAECAVNVTAKAARVVKARRLDICSYYPAPATYDCMNPESTLANNGERGTGLVCDSRLVGILSALAPQSNNNETSCKNHTLKAFYTAVGPHLYWIYEIIGNEEYNAVLNNSYMSSLPYQEQASSPLKENSTTTAAVETTTSFVLALQGSNESSTILMDVNAVGSAVTMRHRTLTLAIWLIIYLHLHNLI